jgi:hypothetical protein
MTQFSLDPTSRAAEQLFDLSRLMIRQAQMLKAAGEARDARDLAVRARELDRLSWSCRAAA